MGTVVADEDSFLDQIYEKRHLLTLFPHIYSVVQSDGAVVADEDSCLDQIYENIYYVDF